MYIILIHHPALARGLRVLQNKNKSPKSLSASQSCAPYNKFLTSPKVASNNFNKSLVMYLLYLKYIKVRWCYSDWPWPVAVPSTAVVGLLGVIYSRCDQEGHSLAVQDQAVLLLVPGNGRCLPSHAGFAVPRGEEAPRLQGPAQPCQSTLLAPVVCRFNGASCLCFSQSFFMPLLPSSPTVTSLFGINILILPKH